MPQTTPHPFPSRWNGDHVDVERLTAPEVGKVLGFKVDAVKSRLHEGAGGGASCPRSAARRDSLGGGGGL